MIEAMANKSFDPVGSKLYASPEAMDDIEMLRRAYFHGERFVLQFLSTIDSSLSARTRRTRSLPTTMA